MKSYLILLFITCFLYSLHGEAKTEKAKPAARKVVRLDFDQPAPVPKKIKKSKTLAKIEKPKKNYKAIECHNGFIVGQKAYCSTTTNTTVAKSSKKGRTVASVSKTSKKLK